MMATEQKANTRLPRKFVKWTSTVSIRAAVSKLWLVAAVAPSSLTLRDDAIFTF
jgi:hypothetical protein